MRYRKYQSATVRHDVSPERRNNHIAAKERDPSRDKIRFLLLSYATIQSNRNG
jgi:hypothetical protein